MRLNIKTKLIGGFLIILVLLLGVGIIGYLNMETINDGGLFVFDHGVIPMKQLDTVDSTMMDIRGNVYEYILLPAQRATIKQLITSRKDIINKQTDAYGATLDNSAEDIDKNQEFTVLETNWKTYANEIDKIVAAVDDGQQIFAFGMIADGGDFANARIAVSEQVIKLQALESKEVEDVRLDNQKAFTNSLYLIIGVAALAMLLTFIVVSILIKGIVGPITKVKIALQKMATGDITETVKVNSRDEVGAMAKAYNETQKYLGNLIAQLKENSTQLTLASEQLAKASRQSSESTQQVATSSQQMAKGAQEQSINAQETAKSIENLSGVINQLSKGAKEQSSGVQRAVTSITEVSKTMSEVAKNANQVAQGAKQAAESANVGAEKSRLTQDGMNKIQNVAGEVAKKLDELGARSIEIGKIVAVIDDIAAQTNLLALNAAIEAARAGEQGRGFAVVSDEVRKLAERTATATKEIADLIGSVQKGVNEANQVMAGGSIAVGEGYDLAKQAGQALDQILRASNEVNAQVELISAKAQQVNVATNDLVQVIDSVGNITEQNTAASEQMTTSASQVSKSIETVAGIAEENSAATEQVSAAAQEMSAQVEEIVAYSQKLKEMAVCLEQSVAMFKVNSNIEDKTKVNSKK